MQKLSKNLAKMKQIVNSSKNRNIRFVKVRQAHFCENCNTLINVGYECVTINRKNQGRSWKCLDCMHAILVYKETQAELDSLPYDDEGGYEALWDSLAEQESSLERRNIIL